MRQSLKRFGSALVVGVLLAAPVVAQQDAGRYAGVVACDHASAAEPPGNENPKGRRSPSPS